MQKVPSLYHLSQNENTCESYFAHPSHHFMSLKSLSCVISGHKENTTAVIKTIYYFFLSFIIMNRITRVNLTYYIGVTRSTYHNPQHYTQPHILCNKLAYLDRLLQQAISGNIGWIEPLGCFSRFIYFDFMTEKQENCCTVLLNLNQKSKITATFQIGIVGAVGNTGIYSKEFTDIRYEDDLQSEYIVRLYACCLNLFDQATSKHNSVQFENRFSTHSSVKYRKSFIYKHKHTIDGIDYMYKKLRNAIYNQSTNNNTIGIYEKECANNEFHRSTKHDSACRGAWVTILIIILETTSQIKAAIHSSTLHLQVINSKKRDYQSKICNLFTHPARTDVIKTFTEGKSFSTAKRLKNLQLNLHLLLLLWLCVPIVSTSYQNIKYSSNIIKTKYGPIRGILKHSNPIVEMFLGVPYASPPVGNLRYMPPVTPSMWKTVRLADSYSPVCHQSLPKAQFSSDFPDVHLFPRFTQLRRLFPLLTNQSEDCLYLNLYVPRSGELVEPYGPPKATIVYIHGDSYEWSSGNLYDGSVLAAEGDVILVTINFRLGVLGFLKTGAKGSAQGNFGLMDLVAALHWLRENLSSFHGDPSRITLMGHGTGAALANILVVSPVANDLINRVILLSGSALSPWAIQKDPIAVKRIVAEQTACHLDLTTDDLAPCLRTKAVKELLRIYPNNPRFLPGFAPFVDGTVIVNPNVINPHLKSLPSGSAITSTDGIEFANFPTRNLLFGLTSYESYYDLNAQDLDYGINETRRDKILRTYVRNVFHIHLKEIYSALRNEYTDWEHPPRSPLGHRDTILELLSDGHTAAPLVRLGYLHSLQKGKSYFLHFRHQTAERDFPLRDGSVRGEDVPFTFGLPLIPLFSTNYTQEDKQISRSLMRYLTNFAKTGNPNGLKISNLEDMPGNNKVNIPHHSNYVPYNKFDLKKRSLLSERVSLFNYRLMNSMYQSSTYSNEMDMKTGFSSTRSINDAFDNDGRFLTDSYSSNDKRHINDPKTEQKLIRYNNNKDTNYINENDQALNLENWKFYDSTNQIYLELGKSGCSALSRSHYRGHKLSMWLSLIPQLHSPDDASYLPVRHHHFAEVKSEHYEGKVRNQPMMKISKLITLTKSTTKPLKTEPIVVTFAETISKDCPPNVTEMATIAATTSQHNQMTIVGSNIEVMNQLANLHYQSYSIAFNITIGVGCFLLLLNVLIFSAIYYQREKHANRNKPKDIAERDEISSHGNLANNDQPCHKTNIVNEDNRCSLKLDLQNTSEVTEPSIDPKGYFPSSSQKKRIVVDICTADVSINEHECPSPRSLCSDYVQQPLTKTVKAGSHDNLLPTFSSQLSSTSDSLSATTFCMHTRRNSLATMGTQSEGICWPETQEVGTSVDEMDLEFSSVTSNISQSPRGAGFQNGILRQQTGSIVHGATKKRVQIQEISV